MRLVRSSILVAVTAAAVAVIPTAAIADANRHVDAVGDVQSVVVDAQGHITDATSIPESTTLGDITMVRAANQARQVKVVVRFAELTRSGDGQEHAIGIPSTAKNRLVVVDAFPGHWGGKARLYTARGKKVGCTVRHRIDYDRNKLVVKVPQSCMGHPKVIKVGARTFIGQGTKLFWDDGYATRGAIKDPFSWSPRIHR